MTGDLLDTFVSTNTHFHGFFGYSVAASGNVVLVGAPNEVAADNLNASGNVYKFDAITGRLDARLISPNVQMGGRFGWSVAMSGETAVIGAPDETFRSQGTAGRAYVFDAATKKLITSLGSPNPQGDGFFGWSVGISGSVVIAGAPLESANGSSFAGRAYTFDATTGALLGSLESGNVQSHAWFGWSVGISGGVDIVGAPEESVNGQSDAGNSYIFNTTSSQLIKTLTSPNSQSYGFFGWSVSANPGSVVTGAFGETVKGQADAGHAYVFKSH